MNNVQKLARQGDILFIKIEALPENLKKVQDRIVAHGEITGHAHRVPDMDGVAVLENEQGDKFINATTDWTITHDEHGPILLEEGIWEARRQREYTPQEIVKVAD
jgi:hypothetical protein